MSNKQGVLNMTGVRKAVEADLPRVAAIYDALHTAEESGRAVIGWIRGVYPTAQTAREALDAGALYVMEDGNEIVASAKINREQVPEYTGAAWLYPDAPPEKIMVLHTLTVDPTCAGKGYGSAFVRFYERFAQENGCPYLRMDTNERNLAARRLYARLGYREAGVVGCTFNGIPGVRLVCLEKTL